MPDYKVWQNQRFVESYKDEKYI